MIVNRPGVKKEEVASISKQLLITSVPITLSFIVNYVKIFTDQAFLGNYETDALVAINNAALPFLILAQIFFSIGNAISILVAQFLGEKKENKAKRVIESAICCNIVFSALFFSICFFFGEKIIVLLGVEGTILTYAVSYIKIISFNFLIFSIGVPCCSAFHGTGYTMPILLGELIGIVLNVFLNWVLIFGNLGFPQLGITGAALATVISTFVVTIIFAALMFNKNKKITVFIQGFTLSFQGIFKPDVSLYLKSLKIGVPMGFENLLNYSIPFILIYLLNQVNELYAGVFGIFTVLLMFPGYCMFGIGIAVLSLSGKSTGAKEFMKCRLIGRIGIFFSLVITIITSIVYLTAPKQIMSIFSADSMIIQFYSIMYILCIILIPKSINVISSYAIKGYGNTSWLLFTQTISIFVVVISAYVCIIHFKFGVAGALIAILLDELTRGILNFWKFESSFYKLHEENNEWIMETNMIKSET